MERHKAAWLWADACFTETGCSDNERIGNLTGLGGAAVALDVPTVINFSAHPRGPQDEDVEADCERIAAFLEQRATAMKGR